MSKNCTEIVCKPLGALNKKPVVISSSKYKKNLTTIQTEEERKKVPDEEQRYKDYVKNGSEEMVSKWTNLKRTQDQKQSEWNEKFIERLQNEKTEFLKICEKDKQIRREQIAKVQELIKKLKPGPKELQSASSQSRTIKARTVQRNITKEFVESLKKRTTEEQLQMERQAMPSVGEEQRRISNNIQRQKQYKAKILNAINEKARKKAELCKAEIVEHKISLGILEEMKEQIEKEMHMLKRKRDALRRNALEAMIMVEQRKARRFQ